MLGNQVRDRPIQKDVEAFEKCIVDPHPDAHRRLIVLEDLSRDWVLVLGSKLNIPPSFFALHYTRPEDLLLGNVRIPLGRSRHRHAIFSYPQPLLTRISNKMRGKKIPPFSITQNCQILISLGVEYRVVCNARFGIKDQRFASSL